MKDFLDKLKNIKIKSLFASALKAIENHTLTVLILVAGILVGFALFSVSSLTRTASNASVPAAGDTPAPLSSLNIDEETEKTLLALRQDTDVTVSSNIASYRRSAFSSITGESTWAINAAKIIEQFYVDNNRYPSENEVRGVIDAFQGTALKKQEIELERTDENGQKDIQSFTFTYEVTDAVDSTDFAGTPVNNSGGDYTYTTTSCSSSDGCQEFTLTDNSDTSSFYQLSEGDVTGRQWVNDMSQYLEAYSKTTAKFLFPTTDTFINEITALHITTLDEFIEQPFTMLDPDGVEVNEDNSRYSYRGIDCEDDGCRGYVLRTTFEDGAQYFRQSQ